MEKALEEALQNIDVRLEHLAGQLGAVAEASRAQNTRTREALAEIATEIKALRGEE